MPTPPSTVSIAGFKVQFNRDFTYGTELDTVTDADLNKALQEASPNFNPQLWDKQELPIAYYYLMAHCLVLSIQAAGGLAKKPNQGQGILSKGSANINAKSVGSVSVNYDTQDDTYKDPILSQFLRTEYGRKYVQMAKARLIGNSIVVAGEQYPDTTVPDVAPLIIP